MARLAITFDPGANLSPYVVADDLYTATWELEAPPESEVRWRETLPVYVGRWPRLFLSSPEAFAGAIVEVAREPGTKADHLCPVGERGVPLQNVDGRYYLDLTAIAALDRYCGSVRLICRPPSQPSANPLTTHFIRVPSMKLTYVLDPAHSEQALAVRVEGEAKVLAAFAEGPDTEVLRGADGIVLRARTPHISPGVSAKLARYDVDVRVRVPTTRVGLITEGGFLGWHPPPLDALDLSTVELRDRLRVELHEEPALEGNKLLCRLVSGDEIAEGQLIGAGGPVWQFEIELHRWRDSFGLSAGGTVQVRTHRRWMDVVRLLEREAPTTSGAIPQPEPISERARLVAALEQALATDDREQARQTVARCLEHIADAAATPVDRELLLLAAARALSLVAGGSADLQEAKRCLVELGDRPDLPEAEILRRTVGLRLAGLAEGGGRLSADDVDRLVDGLPDVPQALLFRAECWYQFARHTTGSSPGGWQTCLELTGRCLQTALRLPERRMALVLHAVARLMLALEPDAAPSGFSPTTAADVWLAGLRLVTQSIRTPRFRVPPSLRPKLVDNEISILSREDAALLRTVVAHAAGRAG